MKVHAPFLKPVLLAGVLNSILETPVIQCAQTGFGLFLTSSTANCWYSQEDLCPPPMTSTMDVKEQEKSKSIRICWKIRPRQFFCALPHQPNFSTASCL